MSIFRLFRRKKKINPFYGARYKIHYHRVGYDENRKLNFDGPGLVDAVNKLLSIEGGNRIFIDYVTCEDV